MGLILKNTENPLIKDALTNIEPKISITDNLDSFDAFKEAKDFVTQKQHIDKNDSLAKAFDDFNCNTAFNFSAKEDKYKKYELKYALSRYMYYIEKIIFFNYQEEYRGMERMAVPPLEADEYVGHNKTKFKSKEINYALLY